jgi:hypothetical protein
MIRKNINNTMFAALHRLRVAVATIHYERKRQNTEATDLTDER